MDQSIRSFLLMAAAAFTVSVFGAFAGDEVGATLPGGRATGVVAGVILLMLSFINAYRSLKKIDHEKIHYNYLDEHGFRSLLNVHFDAISFHLVDLFNKAIQEYKNDPTKFDSNLLVSKTLTIIDQSRNNLTDFKTNKADSIPQYLDKYFSPEHIGQKIEEALDIVANEPDIAVAQQNIFHLIQSVQSALLRKLNTAIEEGNFPKQELRQATT